MTQRNEVLTVLTDRLMQLQAETHLALVCAEAGKIDEVQNHLAEVHMQLSAAMHIFWHYRTELTVKPGDAG